MPTVSRRLPSRPHLEIPKREAQELLKSLRAAEPEALERMRKRHPKYKDVDDAKFAAVTFKLSDAQLVLAREYGFSNWTDLKQRIESNPHAQALDHAIRANDRDQVERLLKQNPALLHIPVWSGNWGPPMSHAANLGRLEMVQAISALGAKDHQHAFDRALLQGRIECARWLHAHGAQLAPGIVMGACETLNVDGLRFLAELNAPFTDEKGDRHASVATVLCTYARHPERKHEMLKIFAERGYVFPDTPIMAFHRGDVKRLKEFLKRDEGLVQRRFKCSEIYPAAMGCRGEGMHGTPLDGTTLLHMAIDYDEPELFDLLLDSGADVNARADIDAEGFGGHTPLFNAVVSSTYIGGRQSDGAMMRQLLEHGASRELRATVRKFLDWVEQPRWHEARDVTAAEWARGFPETDWVNAEALRLLEAR